MLGLCCCAGCSLVVVHGLFIAMVSRCRTQALGCFGSVAEAHGLGSFASWALENRSNSCGAWFQLLCSMWNLPRSGIKTVSPSLAVVFFTTESPLSYNEGSPYCSFDLHFSNGDVQHLFMCLLAICMHIYGI